VNIKKLLERREELLLEVVISDVDLRRERIIEQDILDLVKE
jgi:hypothetical protein